MTEDMKLIVAALHGIRERLALQEAVNKALLAYVEADLAQTWQASAEELVTKLREIIK